jgi:hypothetical protein
MKRVGIAAVLIFLVLLCSAVGLGATLEFGITVLFGWLMHLARVVPAISVDLSQVASLQFRSCCSA